MLISSKKLDTFNDTMFLFYFIDSITKFYFQHDVSEACQNVSYPDNSAKSINCTVDLRSESNYAT